MDDKPDKLSSEEAKQKILFILEYGFVELSFHCQHQSMPRRNVDMLDIDNVLQHGHIIRDPEWDEEYLNWKYLVEGVDIEGDELTAITVILEADLTLFIVTVF